MESFLLTTTTSNPLIGRNSSLSSLPSSSFSSTLSKKLVESGRSRIGKVVTTKVPPSIVASASKRGTPGKGSANVVADGSVAAVEAVDVPTASWKDVQYPPGTIGHRHPHPPVDKEKQMAYIAKILGSTVYDVAIETPLQFAPLSSMEMGCNLWLKREDMQQVNSFKIRGAYNMISQLPKEKVKDGIVCASAGNHAQGVALSAKKLNIKSIIVMPETTPDIKVDAVRRLGGTVVKKGNTFDEAKAIAEGISKEKGIPFIPPYDDQYVIAGQGTVAMEIVRQMRGNIHAIFVPVGGGGLIAGIVILIKLIFPKILVFGVEPNDQNCMAQALYRGEIVNVTDIGHFADGVAVQQAGFETFRICDELLDDVILVTKEQIAAAIKDFFNNERAILEPSGALSIAAAKAYCEVNNIKGVNVVAVTSGANMNFDQLGQISDIANVDQSVIASILPEEPGSLDKLTELIHKMKITIVEMTYRFTDGAQDAIVVYKVKAVGSKLEEMVDALNSAGFETYTWSDNPVVTNHLRYMMGGRAKVENESLFRFTFPEKQGALRHFLKGFKPNWNISLFHHRQQGILTSEVLVGVQMDKSEVEHFHDHARRVGYKFSMVSPDDAAHVLAKL